MCSSAFARSSSSVSPRTILPQSHLISLGMRLIVSCAMRIHLCGGVRVEVEGDHVEGALGGRQGQLLFAYLVLNRFREVPRAEVAAALWPSESARSSRALTTYLSKIRR